MSDFSKLNDLAVIDAIIDDTEKELAAFQNKLSNVNYSLETIADKVDSIPTQLSILQDKINSYTNNLASMQPGDEYDVTANELRKAQTEHYELTQRLKKFGQQRIEERKRDVTYNTLQVEAATTYITELQAHRAVVAAKKAA